MLGLMQEQPLLISGLIEFADKNHHDTAIVSRRVEGDIHRYTYADAARRARQVALALGTLGISPGERAATMAWNNHRHFELYYGISGSGAICHTNCAAIAISGGWVMMLCESTPHNPSPPPRQYCMCGSIPASEPDTSGRAEMARSSSHAISGSIWRRIIA